MMGETNAKNADNTENTKNIKNTNKNVTPEAQPQLTATQRRLLRRARAWSTAALITFLLITFVMLLLLLDYFNSNASSSSMIFILMMWVLPIPVTISFVIAVVAAVYLRRCHKAEVKTPFKLEVARVFTLVQPLLFIGMVILSVALKDAKFPIQRDMVLREQYGTNYTILDSCIDDNYEHGYTTVAGIQLPDVEYPVTVEIAWNQPVTQRVTDNLQPLLDADGLGYQELVEELFGDQALAVMTVKDEEVEFDMLVSTYYLLNFDELKDNLRVIASEYASLFSDEKFAMDIQFTTEFNEENLSTYYLLLSGRRNACRLPITKSLNLFDQRAQLTIVNGRDDPEAEIDSLRTF